MTLEKAKEEKNTKLGEGSSANKRGPCMINLYMSFMDLIPINTVSVMRILTIQNDSIN